MEHASAYRILSRSDEFCGKTVKTKRRITWRLKVGGQELVVEVSLSSLSGKKRVFLNGKLIDEQQNFGSILKHSFDYQTFRFEVLVEGEKVELLVSPLGRMSGNQYADAFLALENQYSGQLVDVYARTTK